MISCLGCRLTDRAGNGIAIAWWRQALKGATIEQLHKSWSFSTSLKDVAFAGKYFNIIALAALTTKLTIVDNMLMQRATSTVNAQDPPVNISNVNLWANESIPVTGAVGGRSGAGELLTPEFNIDLFIWLQNGGLVPAYGAGCEGVCFLKVPAAGFEFDCTAPIVTPINYGYETANASVYASNHNGSLQNTTYDYSPTVFNLAFGAGETDPYNPVTFTVNTSAYSYLTMDVLFTNAKDAGSNGNGGCPGTLTKQTCQLRPAVVEYPVMIQNSSNSLLNASSTLSAQLMNGAMSFDTQEDYISEEGSNSFGIFNRTNKQMNGFSIVEYNNISPLSGGNGNGYGTVPALAGIQQALNMYVGGNAWMYFDGIYGFQLNQTGNAQQYLMNAPSGFQCGYQYSNPVTPGGDWILNSVMKSINQIMFTLATDVYYNSDSSEDESTPLGKDYNATVYRDSVHYVTHEPYMWGAFASMLMCITLVLPTYWGYWQLGRKVSFSTRRT